MKNPYNVEFLNSAIIYEYIRMLITEKFRYSYYFNFIPPLTARMLLNLQAKQNIKTALAL